MTPSTESTPEGLTPSAFRNVMRAPASSVVVLATGTGQRRAGCTVTAICSLSDAPPSLLVCLNERSSALTAILENGCFSANYLREAHDGIADTFAGRTGLRGNDRFDESWLQSENGMPVLTDALASFECDVRKVTNFGSHHIVIGRVLAAQSSSAGTPLIYSTGQYRNLA
ncbi:flavin reductase family protein [Maritimibacter alkaliphilus]|uniref:flavin reductase family protein n=1 Tax=Maritimibacter alkaliphilus TaxID=404236 RepID=UPI001C93B228|nr:flavin reductase family protein [Maritimibacter alkaliphilus]